MHLSHENPHISSNADAGMMSMSDATCTFRRNELIHS